MSPQPFVHLHLHSQYSLLDGAIKLDPLFERAKSLQMPAVGMTDHGNLFGVVVFYGKARKSGIKPIILTNAVKKLRARKLPEENTADIPAPEAPFLSVPDWPRGENGSFLRLPPSSTPKAG